MLKRKIELCMTLLLLVGMILATRKLSISVTSEQVDSKEMIVVIDAGHGGNDPGKVGVNGDLEKDINLQIAKRVEEYLEQQGIQVVMTREDDTTEDSKLADMKKRVQLINEVKPAIVVSIHQNSYSDASVKGAQVFYYEESEEGTNAAAIMQEALKKADPDNVRQIKANDSFYLLKKTQVPTIIVECGFLSNSEESERLVSEEYQKQVAMAICEGLIKWLDK